MSENEALVAQPGGSEVSEYYLTDLGQLLYYPNPRLNNVIQNCLGK